jgi:hypothetical protein
MAELTDKEIQQAVREAPKLSFARKRLGHVLVDRERLLDELEERGHDRDEATVRVEAWVVAVGGRTRVLPPAISEGLRPGRRVAPVPGPSVIALEVSGAAV